MVVVAIYHASNTGIKHKCILVSRIVCGVSFEPVTRNRGGLYVGQVWKVIDEMALRNFQGFSRLSSIKHNRFAGIWKSRVLHIGIPG